jgi:hypothetical protein
MTKIESNDSTILLGRILQFVILPIQNHDSNNITCPTHDLSGIWVLHMVIKVYPAGMLRMGTRTHG